jgi:hypothetical protein
MTVRLIDLLPDIYRSLLPDFFSQQIAVETKATCDTCPMTQKREKAMAKIPLQGFGRETKCCSYQPGHVNYLVGGLLKDASSSMAEGKRRMLARIEQGLGLPYGVSAPSELKKLYEATHSGATTQKANLVCEFYSKQAGGSCTIWKHREAVCSTFFCKHVRGADGRRFWLATKDFLELVEDQLSRYATYQISADLFGRSELALQSDPDSHEMSPAEVWGEYFGRQAQFYMSSFEVVSALNQSELLKIIGFDGMVELDRLTAAKNHLDHGWKLPKRLVLSATVESFSIDDQNIAVMGYLKSDAVVLSKNVFDLLSAFNAESDAKSVLEVFRAKLGGALDEGLIRQLVEHRILREA